LAETFQHALVIGASSGIGEALARRLAAGGCRVALAARRGPELERIAGEIDAAAGERRAWPFAHDVRRRGEIPGLLQTVARTLGGLDLVVYAAGVLFRPAPGEYDAGRDAELLEVNLVGAVAWLDAAAARFARLGRGTIVGIGSIAGDRGRPGAPAYNASKAGLHVFLEALRTRLAGSGVAVVTVKPGFVRTPMVAGMGSLPLSVDAGRAAELILKHARRGTAVAYIPARWRLVSLAVRMMPARLAARLDR